MTMQVNGTTGWTFPDASTQATAATGFGFKNRIINGAMMIDQRNAGASITPTDGQYSVDRWRAGVSAASKFTVAQSSTAPTGFSNSMLCTSSSAYSVSSTDNFEMFQFIEGFNTADLAWGTASAATVTLSFWVRSSLTGAFGGSIQNSAFNRSYPFSYTINAANTWEQKSVTIAGDTTGTWVGATNGIGISVCFSLGAGSSRLGTAGTWAGATYYGSTGQTNLVGTSGATLYITGVQLEKGSTATSFDYRPYGTELALCQRYYQAITNSFWLSPIDSSAVYRRFNYVYPVVMRTAPTGTVTGTTSGTFAANMPNVSNSTAQSANFYGDLTGTSGYVQITASTLSAEL